MKSRPGSALVFVANLRRLMDETKTRTPWLSEKSGVSQRMIRYILSGERTPTVEMADAIARAYGMRGWQIQYGTIVLDTGGTLVHRRPIPPTERPMPTPDAFNDLHQKTLALLTDEFQPYSEVSGPITEATGYDHPFTILSDLVEWGFAEMRIEQLTGPKNCPRGSRHYFRSGA